MVCPSCELTEEMKARNEMNKTAAICQHLQKNHTGKAHAVHSDELEKLFCIDGRNLRRKISTLRQDGHPICSDESGYYYADSQKEINATVTRLNELVLKISNARTGLMYSSVMPVPNGEIEVIVRMKGRD